MINLMRLVKFTKKWKKLAAPERKRISIPRSGEDENTDNNDRLPVANKGHFVVYTVDQRRFEFPISYLNNNIFRELLAMSEEEFGLPRTGPITLLCDAMFMKYAASLMQRNVDKDMEKALHIDISSSGRCSLSFHSLLQEQSSQQLLIFHPNPIFSVTGQENAPNGPAILKSRGYLNHSNDMSVLANQNG
eukprot:XP_002312927.3 auxin-responsive protein SAUR64 [Populus trichocarpa]